MFCILKKKIKIFFIMKRIKVNKRIRNSCQVLTNYLVVLTLSPISATKL